MEVHNIFNPNPLKRYKSLKTNQQYLETVNVATVMICINFPSVLRVYKYTFLLTELISVNQYEVGGISIVSLVV